MDIDDDTAGRQAGLSFFVGVGALSAELRLNLTVAVAGDVVYC